MIVGSGIFFPQSIRPLFPVLCGKERTESRLFSSSRFAGLDLCESKKARLTPALQRKFPSAPPFPCASAFAARSVKGRFAFRSATLHSTLDFAARLRPTLHTTAAPKEISFQGRAYQKAQRPYRTFSPRPSSLSLAPIPCFPGVSFPLSMSGPDAFPVSVMRFPPPRPMLAGILACACPVPDLRFPQARSFVQRHLRGPAYPTYIRWCWQGASPL